MKAYKHRNLYKQNFIQKFFKKLPKKNFILEIENYLDEHEDNLNELSYDSLSSLVSKYKVNWNRSFENNKRQLFEAYLDKVLEDEVIEDSEHKALKKLQQFLQLKDAVVNNIITQKTHKIYKNKVTELTKDNYLDDSDKLTLEKIKKDLLLSDETANQIYAQTAGKILEQFVNNAVEDGRLSPDEEKQLEELQSNLGISISLDDKSKAVLEKYKLYWTIENGELPTIDSDINLQKNESLYFKTNINWHELRTVTKRINYTGGTGRIRICKGVYYRIGSVKPQRMTEDVLTKIDTGMLYLTSKRLIFIGTKGNKSIKLNTILMFEPYSNGVQIEKATGKSPMLGFSDNVEVFSMILSRLINETM